MQNKECNLCCQFTWFLMHAMLCQHKKVIVLSNSRSVQGRIRHFMEMQTSAAVSDLCCKIDRILTYINGCKKWKTGHTIWQYRLIICVLWPITL